MKRAFFILLLVLFTLATAFSESKGDPLMLAAREGNIKKMQSIIKKKKGNVDFQKGQYPATYGPLQAAAYAGKLEAVKLLVESGYDVNCGLSTAESFPISLAMTAGHFDIVSYLLEKNADPSGVSLYGLLKEDMDDSRKALLKKLINHGIRIDPQDFGICKSISDLEYLLSEGFSIGSTDSTGMTALHYAAYFMNQNAVNLLIERGVNINAKDIGGYTPLFYALLSIGAKVKYGDLIGEEKYKDQLINVIKHTGEEPYYGNISDLVSRQITIVDTLLKSGADSNAQSQEGNTVLHMLACTRKATTIEYLLNAGAKKDLANDKSETPYDIAVKNAIYLKNDEVINLLRKE